MASRHGFAHRLRGFGAAALVVGLLLGPLAGAGQSAELSEYAGSGSGFALRTVVDLSVLPATARTAIQDAYADVRAALPADAQALLPEEFSFVMDQRFIETLATIGESTKATSLLGTGFPASVSATAVGQKETSHTNPEELLSADLPLVSISAADLVASVASGPKVDATGTLATITVALDALADIFETAGLTPVFTAIQDAITDAVNTANGALDTALGEVGTTLSETCDTVVGDTTISGILEQAGIDPGVGCDDVAGLTSDLQSIVNISNASNLLDSTLASITGLDNASASQKTSDGVIKSDATSKLAGINVLNMLRIGVVDLASHSEAAGTAGSAKNTNSCSLASVKLGDADDGVSLDGTTLYVNNQAVPVVGDAIATIKGQVDAVLAAAGLSVDLCDEVVQSAAADGTSASQTVSALRVEFAPKTPIAVEALGLAAGDTVLRILVDPSVETVASAQVASAPQPALPRTGAAPLGTILAGLGIAGGALLLRRRLA